MVVPSVLAGLAWFLLKTDVGIAVRAAAENADRALLLGIPIRRLSTIVWMVAGAPRRPHLRPEGAVLRRHPWRGRHRSGRAAPRARGRGRRAHGVPADRVRRRRGPRHRGAGRAVEHERLADDAEHGVPRRDPRRPPAAAGQALEGPGVRRARRGRRRPSSSRSPRSCDDSPRCSWTKRVGLVIVALLMLVVPNTFGPIEPVPGRARARVGDDRRLPGDPHRVGRPHQPRAVRHRRASAPCWPATSSPTTTSTTSSCSWRRAPPAGWCRSSSACPPCASRACSSP